MENTVILATDSIVAKAYIQALGNSGYSPGRIICLQMQNSNQSKARRLASRLKRVLRGFTESSESVPSWLRNFEIYCKSQDLFVPDYNKTFAQVLKESGVKYQWLAVDGIEDEKLRDFMENSGKEKYVIYCCGGLLLRKNLLSGSKKYIHVHPGLVPEVKGSDGMLWSSMVHDLIGMSAFFMNEGIDTGDILERKEYPIPKLDLSGKDLNHAVLADEFTKYIDPVYRADLMVQLFENAGNPAEWNFEKQDPSAGKVYYFMHKHLKKIAAKAFL